MSNRGARANIIDVDIDIKNVSSLKKACQRWIVGSRAKELYKEAENNLQNALVQAYKGEVESFQQLSRKSEAGYKEALLAGLQTGLIDYTQRHIEAVKSHLSSEKYNEIAKKLDMTKKNYSNVQRRFMHDPNLSAEEFLKIVKKIDTLLDNGIFPDLRIKLFEIQNSQLKGIVPFPPLTDRPTSLTVVVENIGLAAVEQSFVTELYVDGVLTKTWKFPSDAEILDQSKGSTKIQIKSGGSRVYGYDVNFPQGGKHHFTWIVDAKNQVLESDKTNNQLDVDLVWQEPPDLIVEDISPVGSAFGGQESTWKIKIRNQGKGDVVGSFLTGFYPDVPGGSYENFWASSLPAGQSLTFTSKQKFRSWGQRNIRAEVDVGNLITEALPNGETNNELVKTFNLLPVDLEVKDLIVDQGLESTTFTFVVSNNGPGDATLPFKVRIWPGKVIQPYLAQPKNYLIQPEILTVNPLETGHSVTLKHTVNLPAGDYTVIIEADYPDPDYVYYEPNCDNNILVQQVHIEEKYYVKIAKIEYRDKCKMIIDVYLDRSGAYWKGDVVLRLMYQNKVVDETNTGDSPWWENPWGFFAAYKIDAFPDHNWTAQVAVVAFAKLGNQLIPSPDPAKLVDIYFYARPVLTGIVPNKATPGSKVQVAITGQNLTVPCYSSQVDVGFHEVEMLIGDEKINVKVLQETTNSIMAEFDIHSDAQLGKRAVWVDHCTSSSYWWLDFDIVSSIPVNPPPPPLLPNKPDLWIHSIWAEPALPGIDEAFTIKFDGGNIGTAPSPSCEVKLVLSGNANETQEITLQNLATGQGFVGQWPFPSGLNAGNYFIDIYLDSQNTVDELNKNNNWTSIGIIIY